MSTPSFEAPKEIRFEEPLRSPHLSEDADRELDRLVEGGVSATGEAWEKVTRKHGKIDPIERSVSDAARRLVDDDNVPQPAPPKPGESDEQIRQRHRDALRSRGDIDSPKVDTDHSASNQDEQSLVQ